MSTLGLDPPPEPPPRLTEKGRAALLRQPGWYIYGSLRFPDRCIGCGRTLNAGDVVRCEYGLTLQQMKRRGACCRLPARPVFTDDTVEHLARTRPAPRQGGFFG